MVETAGADDRDSAGPDCRILAMRKYARWQVCLPTLSTAGYGRRKAAARAP